MAPRTTPPAHAPTRLLLRTAVVVGCLLALLAPAVADAAPPLKAASGPSAAPEVTTLATGLAGTVGSTIGPDGDLYVTEPLAGAVRRIDRKTGATTDVVTGLPAQVPAIGLGGPMDVAFVDETAYVVTTLVGPAFGTDGISGVYRVEDSGAVTEVADLGAWSVANPPSGFPWFVPSGVQYALEVFRGDLLVTDGHHNRVLKVTPDGAISEFVAFGADTVPTGLEVRGNRILLGLAGPVPHLPEDGRVVSLAPDGSVLGEVGAGARLLVDLAYGTGGRLFTLSQGLFPVGDPPGFPATADTGALLLVDDDGGMTELVTGLDRPTSLEVVGNSAWVTTLDGEVVRIDGLPRPR